MDSLTSVIVLFIFACFIYRHLVKNRPQFYGALAAMLVVILLASIAAAVNNPAFTRLVILLNGVLQIGAILLLVMSVGGLSPDELAGEMRDAFDAVRKGDDRPVIVPLTGEQAPPRESRPPPPRRPVDEGPIPLE